MKYLWLLLFIPLLWATPVEAVVNWESYSDPARPSPSNNFTLPGSWVYMGGSGLQKNKAYQVKFYDADPNNYPLSPVLVDDSQSDNNGVVLSQVKPSAYPTSSSGLWKAELWKMQPLTLEATDTFTVAGSSIPEIPTVFAGIAVAGICFGIYRWRRNSGKN